jgi:heme/copper-type cytochrome/quinol oxidase subunit 2
MNASHKRVFNRRKFVSIGLFLTLIVLVITAVVIQIFEALENELFTHLLLVTHIFTGLAFTVLSVFHAKMNWQSMKVYVKAKQSVVSKEAIYAFLLTVITILIGVLFVLIIMD